MSAANLIAHVGQRFNTDSERGCEVVTLPDADGNFDAFDSDRVLCSFSTAMVRSVCCNGELVKAIMRDWTPLMIAHEYVHTSSREVALLEAARVISVHLHHNYAIGAMPTLSLVMLNGLDAAIARAEGGS